MTRILSWNILHGGGKRHQDILAAIDKTQPDIVTLQEFRNGSNLDTLSSGLSQIGLKQQYIPATQSAGENTVMIASRHEFHAEPFPRSNIKTTTRILKAVFPDLGNLSFFAAHLPQKKAQLPFFHALLDLPRSYRDENSLIIGDLNCGIPFEDSETSTFYATHLFQELLRSNWTDAWRSRNIKAREFTWISTKQQNGYRYDHALVSKQLDRAIQGVHYNHEVRLKKISDHSQLILDIDIPD